MPGITAGTGPYRAADPELDRWTAAVPDLVRAALADLGLGADADLLAAATVEALEAHLLRVGAPDWETGPADRWIALLGETARRAVGGVWELQPGRRDQGSRNGWPYLHRLDDVGDPSVFRPRVTIGALLSTRAPGTVATSLRAYARR